ncbi:MAG: hypothetical protein ACKO34_08135 [Vampirovibrionales bacterium]
MFFYTLGFVFSCFVSLLFLGAMPALATETPTTVPPFKLFPTLSQLKTSTPQAYCAPTSLTMGVLSLEEQQQLHQQAYPLIEQLAHTYLHMDRQEGTTAANMLKGTQDFLKAQYPTQPFEVQYQGIHWVENQVTRVPCLKLLLVQPANQFTIVHVGWYAMVPSRKQFNRLGGHYVLLNHTSRVNKHFYMLRFNDPLQSEEQQEQAEYNHLVPLKTILKDSKQWVLKDTNEFIDTRISLETLWVFDPMPSKSTSILPVLEGVLTVKRVLPVSQPTPPNTPSNIQGR